MSCLKRAISWCVLGLIAVITLFAFLTSYYGWKIYLELFSHFQVQYFVISLILLGILLLLRPPKLVYAGIFLCMMLSVQILPWYIFPSHLFSSASAQTNLRVLIANINTKNKSYSKVLDLVRTEKPDLAIFMEVDEVWKAQLNTLNDLLPYSSGQSNPYNLGLLVYSNQSLNDARVEFFGTENNVSVIAQLTIRGKPLTLLATHPFPPVKPSYFHSRNRQLALISQYLAEINNPIILAGDLNMTMWSTYYRRLVRKTNLRNTRKGFGILPTWPTKGTYQRLPGWLTPLFRIPIDHCLISHGLDTSNIYTGSSTGSDHKPLIVDLYLTAGERKNGW